MAIYQVELEDGSMYEVETEEATQADPSRKPKRKDVIDAATGGKDLIPQENWIARGLYQTGKDIATAPMHYANQFLLNLPRAAANKANMDYPEAESGAGNALAKLAGVAGGINNPTSKFVTSAPNLLQLALRSGLAGAAYTPTKDMVGLGQRATSGVLSAAVPVAGRAVSKTLSAIPKRNDVAGRIINSLIKPTKGQFGYGKNPGLAVAQEKIVGNSLDELADNIATRKDEIGKQIGKVLDKSKAMVNMKGVLSPIDEALAMARKAPNTNATLIARLQGIRSDLRGIVGGKDLELAAPKLANEMKQQIGALTKFTGSPSDDKLTNLALKRTYGKLRGRIEEVVSEVGGLNERWGNLMTAEIAAKNRADILQRQNLVGFTSTAAGLGTALTYALISGGKTIPSALAGLGAAEIVNLTKSPKVMTRLASWLSTASKQEKQTVFQKLPQLKEAILKGGIALPSRIRVP